MKWYQVKNNKSSLVPFQQVVITKRLSCVNKTPRGMSSQMVGCLPGSSITLFIPWVVNIQSNPNIVTIRPKHSVFSSQVLQLFGPKIISLAQVLQLLSPNIVSLHPVVTLQTKHCVSSSQVFNS